jgi:hypothetical protein
VLGYFDADESLVSNFIQTRLENELSLIARSLSERGRFHHVYPPIYADTGRPCCPRDAVLSRLLAENENRYGNTDPRWERKAYLRVRLWSPKIN